MTDLGAKLGEEGKAAIVAALDLQHRALKVAMAATEDDIKFGEIFLRVSKIGDALRRAADLNPADSLETVLTKILDLELSEEVRDCIAAVREELNIDEPKIKNHHFTMGLEAAARLCKTPEPPKGRQPAEGLNFLQDIFAKNEEKIRENITFETANALNRFETELKEKFGEGYEKGSVHILFNCLAGDIDKVRAIVDAQVDFDPATDPDSKKTNFFQELIKFIGSYSYISQYLIEQSPQGAIIKRRSQEFLELLLSSPEMLEPRPNFYKIMVKKDDGRGDPPAHFHSPWLDADLKNTPYDVRMLNEAILTAEPEYDLAKLILGINEYAASVVERGNSSRDLRVGPSAKKKKKRAAPVQAINPVYKSIDVRKFMLGLIRPKSIIMDPDNQREFGDLLKRIRKSKRIAKNDRMLAASISTILHQRYELVEIPLPLCRNRSIKQLLSELVYKYFDDDAIRNGVDIGGKKVKLFPPPEAAEIGPTESAKNFDTAAVGIDRPWLSEVAKKLYKEIFQWKKSHDLEKLSPFAQAIKFAEEQVDIYLNLRRPGKELADPKYKTVFYNGATEAFKDIFRHCFPPLAEGDHAVSTSEEHPSITNVFGPGGIRKVETNHHSGASKNSEELFTDICGQVDPTKTRMIILSSKTKFGGAPCSQFGEQRNNFYLAKLVKKLKNKYPTIPVTIDACQAIGRSYSDSLAELEADLYLTSGSKALGIGPSSGTAATITVKREILERSNFKPSYETEGGGHINRERVLAMALSMQMLHAKFDPYKVEGNLGTNNKGLMLEEKIAAHMGALTAHMLSKMDKPGYKIAQPTHGNDQDYTGIISATFPCDHEKLKTRLGQHGYKVSQENGSIRISCHYLQEKPDIDALFEKIDQIIAGTDETPPPGSIE